MTTRYGHVSLRLLDSLGVESSSMFPVNIDDTKTIAQALTDAQVLAGDVDAISDSQITEVSLKLIGPLPIGGKTGPIAGAENERTGLFNFSQSGSPYRWGVDIPGMAQGKISAGKINLSDAAVSAFIAFMIAAGTALTPVSTSPHTLVALLDALLAFRKHRRAESRRSFEV